MSGTGDGKRHKTLEMLTIYISEVGDDTHDGLTLKTAVRSWQRALALSGGDSEVHLHGRRHA
jgi:hypothetical protein